VSKFERVTSPNTSVDSVPHTYPVLARLEEQADWPGDEALLSCVKKPPATLAHYLASERLQANPDGYAVVVAAAMNHLCTARFGCVGIVVFVEGQQGAIHLGRLQAVVAAVGKIPPLLSPRIVQTLRGMGIRG
jgi:hypothetical protein